jgi:hypothetical protein
MSDRASPFVLGPAEPGGGEASISFKVRADDTAGVAQSRDHRVWSTLTTSWMTRSRPGFATRCPEVGPATFTLNKASLAVHCRSVG